MRISIQLLTIAAMFLGLTLNAQITKSHMQMFVTNDAEWVELDIPNNQVEVRETKGSRILVDMSITLDVDNPQLIDFLINSGRYNLVSEHKEGRMLLRTTKVTNVVVVRGQEVLETVQYTISLPESVEYTNVSVIVE